MERRAVGCGPRRLLAHCRGQPGPPAAPAILAYTGEDVDILDRRARVRSNPRGTMSRILSLRLRQRLLRLELRNAKKRLMVPDARWDYNRKFSFSQNKANLKKSHVFLCYTSENFLKFVTSCFDYYSDKYDNFIFLCYLFNVVLFSLILYSFLLLLLLLFLF